MKNITFLICGLLCSTILANAQNRNIPVDTTVVTAHTTTINGATISYTATTGTQPVWDELGKPIATLFYTYYKKIKKSSGSKEAAQFYQLENYILSAIRLEILSNIPFFDEFED